MSPGERLVLSLVRFRSFCSFGRQRCHDSAARGSPETIRSDPMGFTRARRDVHREPAERRTAANPGPAACRFRALVLWTLARSLDRVDHDAPAVGDEPCHPLLVFDRASVGCRLERRHLRVRQRGAQPSVMTVRPATPTAHATSAIVALPAGAREAVVTRPVDHGRRRMVARAPPVAPRPRRAQPPARRSCSAAACRSRRRYEARGRRRTGRCTQEISRRC